jgi:hypothetical protein
MIQVKNVPANLVKKYQCSGCMNGPTKNCFKEASAGIGCDNHYAGTMVSSEGTIFKGMPKGFNRLGDSRNIKITIFKTRQHQQEQWPYNTFNIPVWKHKNKSGHIIVRGISPRTNCGYIHVIEKGDFESIDAINITEAAIEKMD